jgi:hypothetical protein
MEKNKQTRQSFSDRQGGMNINGLFGIEGLVDNSASTIGGLGKGPGNTTGVGGNVPITSLMPLVDPTYRSGFDYARSIAGGMPMSQVIAPGVSYSPEQPMGYTQEQLNTAIGITPVEPPPPTGPTYKEGIEDMIRIPPSERGVTIPVDRKMPPLRDLFGGSPTQMPLPIPDYDPRDIDIDAIRQKIAESGIDFTNLFGLPKFDIPTVDEGVGTGGGFIGGPVTVSDTPFTGAGMAGAGARPDLPPPTESALFGALPPISSIENIIQDPSMANIPTPPIDLPIDLPNIMDLPPVLPPANIPPVIEMPPIRGVGRPNQNRFSIQQLPRELF